MVRFGADLVYYLVLQAIQQALLVFFRSKLPSPPTKSTESETSVSMMNMLTLVSLPL
jgi:hypothetical protein